MVSWSARNRFSVTTSRAVRSARNAAVVSGTTSRMRSTASLMAETFRASTAASTTRLQHSPHEGGLERTIVEVIQNRPDTAFDQRRPVAYAHHPPVPEHPVGERRRRFVQQHQIDRLA